MTEYELKARRILQVAGALTIGGAAVFAAMGGLDAAIAFALACAVSVGGLWVLARGISAFTQKRPSGFTAVLFLSRLFAYAFALSAMMKVYPGQATPIGFGICVAIAAIILEALIESFSHARRT
jgi:hypothetical protein